MQNYEKKIVRDFITQLRYIYLNSALSDNEKQERAFGCYLGSTNVCKALFSESHYVEIADVMLSVFDLATCDYRIGYDIDVKEYCEAYNLN